MQVNMVIPDSGDGESGQGRYAESLATALAAQGVDVHRAGFRYLPLAERRSILKTVPIGIAGGKPGAVNHLVRIKGASLLLARRIRPVVATVHDLGILYCPEDQILIESFHRRQVLRLSLHGVRRADHVIAVSEFTRSCLLRAGFAPDRVTSIPLGVDGERFRPYPGAADAIAQRYNLTLPPTHATILYVGNELPRKNLGVLVEALFRLKTAGVPFRWLKVGASNYSPGRAALEQQIERYGLRAEVTIVDRVSEEDLPLFYSAATVLVQPSVWEGFGLPVLEAMACGAPVVSSTSASLPEVCGDAAVLVDARDPEAIARGVQTVVGDPKTAERLREAGRRHAARFTWAETAARTQEVYRCIGGDGTSPADSTEAREIQDGR